MLKDPGSTASRTDASNWPEEGRGHPAGWWVGYPGTELTCPEYNYPNYDPHYKVAPVAGFLTAYGLPDPDRRRLDFYLLLDPLTWG